MDRSIDPMANLYFHAIAYIIAYKANKINNSVLLLLADRDLPDLLNGFRLLPVHYWFLLCSYDYIF